MSLCFPAKIPVKVPVTGFRIRLSFLGNLFKVGGKVQPAHPFCRKLTYQPITFSPTRHICVSVSVHIRKISFDIERYPSTSKDHPSISDSSIDKHLSSSPSKFETYLSIRESFRKIVVLSRKIRIFQV